MSKVTKQSIKVPSLREDRAIRAAARLDPDAPPLTKKQLGEMVPLKSLRGRPKLESKKVLVSIRYSPEVIKFFKSTGEGWQSRIDGVLRRYVTSHTRKSAR
jgi:uncharacterized protein (DUF4415 family)